MDAPRRPMDQLRPVELSPLILEAGPLLVAAANPVKVLLFGSQARGHPRQGSDFDFLVILASVEDRFAEMVRLQRSLAPLKIPADVLVYSVQDVEDWVGVRQTLIHRALQEGIVLYDAP